MKQYNPSWGHVSENPPILDLYVFLQCKKLVGSEVEFKICFMLSTAIRARKVFSLILWYPRVEDLWCSVTSKGYGIHLERRFSSSNHKEPWLFIFNPLQWNTACAGHWCGFASCLLFIGGGPCRSSPTTRASVLGSRRTPGPKTPSAAVPHPDGLLLPRASVSIQAQGTAFSVYSLLVLSNLSLLISLIYLVIKPD